MQRQADHGILEHMGGKGSLDLVGRDVLSQWWEETFLWAQCIQSGLRRPDSLTEPGSWWDL